MEKWLNFGGVSDIAEWELLQVHHNLCSSRAIIATNHAVALQLMLLHHG